MHGCVNGRVGHRVYNCVDGRVGHNCIVGRRVM